MKIVFVTTQSIIQSTLVGRIIPMAKEIAEMKNDVTLLVHEEERPSPHAYRQAGPPSPRTGEGNDAIPSPYQGEGEDEVKVIAIGKNPFIRTAEGKKRKRGIGLLWLMLGNAMRSAKTLVALQPDVIVIVKPLPENTLAVMFAKILYRNAKIVLDVDDFELFANVVSSLPERAVLHWSERNASKMTQHIITATPFLSDHMAMIAQKDVPITLIPTGLSIETAIQKNNSHVITYIGSISQSSGHLVFMLPEIMEQVRKVIPDAKMLIAGSGDDEQKLKQLFLEKKLDNSVEWFGRFSEADIAGIVSRTDVFIDPIDDSIVNRAKSSYRAMIACASGLPVVTSNIGIRPMILPASLHAKLFARAGDATQYAEKIIALLQQPLSGEEAKLLQEKSAQYSYEELAKLYYNSLV